MKPRRHSLLPLALLTAAGWSVRAAMAQVTPDYGVIIHTAGQMLMEMHYLPVEIDDRLSRAALDQWLGRLDPQRLYYTADDIAALYRQYGSSLDDAVFLSDIRPFRALYNDYVSRVRTRLAQSRAMLQGEALTLRHRCAAGKEPPQLPRGHRHEGKPLIEKGLSLCAMLKPQAPYGRLITKSASGIPNWSPLLATTRQSPALDPSRAWQAP